MKRNAVYLTGALAISLAMAVSPAYAKLWHAHKSPMKSTNVTISSSMKLANGTRLDPGTYRLELSEEHPSPEALFYKDGTLVARSPVKLESQPQKPSQTEILSNNQGGESVITEIDPSGWANKLVLGSTARDTAKRS